MADRYVVLTITNGKIQILTQRPSEEHAYAKARQHKAETGEETVVLAVSARCYHTFSGVQNVELDRIE